jgi:hypothetical protein
MQLQLDESSSELATVNTPKGLMAVTRLPYGVSSSAAIFQREMDRLLGDIPGVAAFLDDVLITGKDLAEMNARRA